LRTRRPRLEAREIFWQQDQGAAVALTSQPQHAGFPLTLELQISELRKPTWAKISQIRTLSVEWIGRRLAGIAPRDVSKVIEGLNEILGE
jgi:mRNA interferase MazF